MNVQLIQGQFSTKDAIDIITQMINVKIKFHENKINSAQAEEDIKMREQKIKQLQQQLQESRNCIGKHSETITMEAELLFKLNEEESFF